MSTAFLRIDDVMEVLVRLPSQGDVCNLLCTCRCIGHTFKDNIPTLTRWLLCTGRFYTAAAHPHGGSALQRFLRYDTPTFLRACDPVLNPLEEETVTKEEEEERRRAMNDVALVAACKAGRSENARLLLDEGADANVRGVLVEAAARGDAHTARLLLRYGADVHTDEDDALRIGAESGHAAVVRTVIEHGANLHALNHYALRHSCRLGHVQVVAALLQHGAPRHAATLPFAKHVRKSRRKEIRALLLGEQPI